MARTVCSSTGKQRFPSKLEADLAISYIQGKNNRNRKQKFREEPNTAKPCDRCGGWHMARKSKTRNRRTVSN